MTLVAADRLVPGDLIVIDKNTIVTITLGNERKSTFFSRLYKEKIPKKKLGLVISVTNNNNIDEVLVYVSCLNTTMFVSYWNKEVFKL